MRLFCALGVMAALVSSASAATVVANFGGDFASPTPSSGWSYLWNGTGKTLGNSANYSALTYNSSNSEYETISTGSLPHSGDGGYLSVFSTGVRLGQTGGTTPPSSDGNSHYAILGYTFTSAQVAADGPYVVFHTYNFSVPNDPTLGPLDVQIYRNNTQIADFPFPAGTTFSDSLYGTDYLLGGPVSGGDTLYIALGGTTTYSGQSIGVAYTLGLSQTPEPAIIGVVAPAILLFIRRRR